MAPRLGFDGDKAKERAVSQVQEQLIEVSVARALVYRTLSSLYFKELTDEQIDALAKKDLSAFDGLDPLFAQGVHDIERSLRRKNTATRQLLAVDFAGAILGAGVHEERRATPFESVFTSEAGLLMQEARDEVYRAFLDERLEVNGTLRVPEDHLSFLFEFMAVLCDRFNEALGEGDAARACGLLSRQRAFHANHLLNWIDAYCDCLEGCAETRFYQGVAKMTRSFVHLDEELLHDLHEVLLEEFPGCDAVSGAEEAAHAGGGA